MNKKNFRIAYIFFISKHEYTAISEYDVVLVTILPKPKECCSLENKNDVEKAF